MLPPRPLTAQHPDEVALFSLLNELSIGATVHRHPPVFTVAEAKALRGSLPGAHVKNLLLIDRKKALWLITALEDRPLDLKRLVPVIGAASRLSFASPRRLLDATGLEPGAVTPLGVLRDTDHTIRLILDETLRDYDLVNVHPLHNAATLGLRVVELERVLAHAGHPPTWIDLADAAPPD